MDACFFIFILDQIKENMYINTHVEGFIRFYCFLVDHVSLASTSCIMTVRNERPRRQQPIANHR